MNARLLLHPAALALLLAPAAWAQRSARALPPPPVREPDWTAETFAAAHPATAPAASGGDAFTLTGAWPYGPSYAVEARGKFELYRGQGRVLEVLLFPPGPGEPSLVSSLVLPGIIRDIVSAPPYLYVGTSATGVERGLYVVDMTFPPEPVVVARLTGFSCYGIALDGEHAYLSAFDTAAALYVVDVADPAAPALEATLGLSGFSYGLAAADGYAYVAGGDAGLHVVDVSDPASPSLASTLGLGGYVRRVALGEVDGTAYAAVAVGSYTTGVGFVSLLDLTDPAAPAAVGAGPTTQPVEDVAWDGASIYAASSYDGLAVYSAGVGGLTLLSTFSTSTANLVSGANRVTTAAPGLAHVADYYNGTHAFDDATGFFAHRVGQSYAYDVVVDGGDPSVGWLADGAYGLVRLDLAEPDTLIETARVHGMDWNYSYAVAQTPTHLYVADGYSVVWVVQKASLDVVNHLFISSGFADGVATSDDGALLFAWDTREGGPSQAYDLADPNSPVLLWERGDLDAYDVESTGTVAYVGTETDAFVHVLDAVDTPSPVLVRSLDVDGGLVGLSRDGGRLYAYGGPDEVTVFDLSDPLDPQQVGAVFPVDGYAMDAEEDVLYLAELEGLTVYDVADPAAPVLLAESALWAAAPLDVVVEGEQAYVADGNAGLYRFALDLVVAAEPGPSPEAFSLAAWPNPAAGRATLSYTLPEAGRVRLSICDVLGREVAVVTDGAQAAGPHEVVLDLSALSPGFYLVRLETGGQALARPLTALR